MQQKFYVGNIENSNPLLAVVLLSRDWKRCFETNYYYIFSQKHVVYRLMYSQYKNPNTLDNMGKANCH